MRLHTGNINSKSSVLIKWKYIHWLFSIYLTIFHLTKLFVKFWNIFYMIMTCLNDFWHSQQYITHSDSWILVTLTEHLKYAQHWYSPSTSSHGICKQRTYNVSYQVFGCVKGLYFLYLIFQSMMSLHREHTPETTVLTIIFVFLLVSW